MNRRPVACLASLFVFLGYLIAMPAAAQDVPVATFDADSWTPLAEAELPSSVELEGAMAVARAGAYVPAVPMTWSVPRASTRPTLLPSMYVALAGLQSYDAYSTIAALGRGAVETNPVVRGVLSHPAALVALKSATTAGSIYLAERLWRRQRRVAAIVLMGVTNGMMAAVAARNASVLRTQR